jgi:hypothetical protein
LGTRSVPRRFVWYYKVNRELRDYDPDIEVEPGIALLAVLLGWIVIFIFAWVSVYRTGDRIQQAQTTSGANERCNGWLGILFYLAVSTWSTTSRSSIRSGIDTGTLRRERSSDVATLFLLAWLLWAEGGLLCGGHYGRDHGGVDRHGKAPRKG